jgi:hypothetical protein
MNTIAFAIITIALTGGGAARAAYLDPAFITDPFAAPQYSGPPDTYQTTPNRNGRFEYGQTTTGPGGRTCVTVPDRNGRPQYGVTTTCN